MNAQTKVINPINGLKSDISFSSCMDNEGNIYLTGFIQDKADVAGRSIQPKGDSDFFILRSDTSGFVQWINLGGGKTNKNLIISEYGKVVNVNSNDEIIVCGVFNCKGYFNDNLSLKSNGGDDIFVANFSSNGKLNWVKNFGGIGHDAINDMIIDKNNNIILTGLLSSPFDFGVQKDEKFRSYAFIAIISSTGDLVWMKKYSSPKGISAAAICQDRKGSIFWGINFIDRINEIACDSFGNNDCYVEKINKKGELIWKYSFGGKMYDKINSMIIDNYGNLCIIGTFSDHMILGSDKIVSYGNADIFVSLISREGKHLWSKNYGGIGYDEVGDIALTDENILLVSGNYSDFFINDESSVKAMDRDAFIMVIDQGSELIGFKPFSGFGSEKITSLSVIGSKVLVSGYFRNNLIYDSLNILSSGDDDIFYLTADIKELLFGSYDDNHNNYSSIDASLSIKPNPTNSSITIECHCELFDKMIIYTIEGEVIEEVMRGVFPYYYEFLEHSKGIYLIKININSQIYTRKVVVN
jgi:hypothetical protein